MAVIRVEKTKNYTVMSNYHLRDKNLSLKAKGLLSFMLSLPEEWDYSVKGLVSCLKEGRDGVQAALMELEQCGYLKRERARTAEGRLSGAIYTVYEQPMTENPAQEKPAQEKPAQGNRTQINTKGTTTKETITEQLEEEEEAGWREVMTCYQNNIRPICGEIEMQRLHSLYKECGRTWVLDAIQECVINNVRKLNYLQSILDRWQSEGKVDSRKKTEAKPSQKKRGYPTQEDFAKARAEMERRMKDAGEI
jgi:DnaD/phage-associated family protein